MTAQHGIVLTKQQANTRIDILLEGFAQKQFSVHAQAPCRFFTTNVYFYKV